MASPRAVEGAAAVGLLMEKIKAPRRLLPTLALPFALLEGQTTAPPRQGRGTSKPSRGLPASAPVTMVERSSKSGPVRSIKA